MIGSRFIVDSVGRHLRFVSNFTGIRNGDFESGESNWIARSWFGKPDLGVGVDRVTSHTGMVSGVIRAAPGNGRFHKKLRLTSLAAVSYPVMGQDGGVQRTYPSVGGLRRR